MAAGQTVAVGLDLGTGGARAVAVNMAGGLVAEGRADLPQAAMVTAGPRVEQDPRAWTAAVDAALSQVTSRLPPLTSIVGVAADATSGTFLLLDADRQPLTPGIMYNDLRATAEAAETAAALREDLQPYGIAIAPAFALPKLLHLLRRSPELFARCRHIVHQTDWIVGGLCGRYDVTDISTALKTGADPGRLSWPAAIGRQLGIPSDRLPAIVLPGTVIGAVTPEASARTGLPAGTPVVAGCTDGTAGCLASGAKDPGDLNVTLGTTLIFKGIAARPLLDPLGEVYNHRHPGGGYLPGAASSTGGEWVQVQLPGANLDQLSEEAARCLPTHRQVYPLVKTGERFPFACPAATGFGFADIAGLAERFAAGMEGTAFVERLGIQRLTELGLPAGPTVFATGGGVAGETWLRIRAAVNRRIYAVPENAECAVGAAVLAVVPSCGSYSAAAAALIRAGRQVPPEDRLADAYDEPFARFCDALRREAIGDHLQSL